VGFFSLALRCVYLPVSLLTAAIRPVFFEKAAIELKGGGLEPFVLQLLAALLRFGVPSLVFLYFEGEAMFRFFLGAQWAEAGAYAALLGTIGYVELAAGWLDRVFEIQEQQHVSLLWESCRSIVSVGALALTLSLSISVRTALGVYVGINFVAVAVWVYLVFKIAHFSFKGIPVILRDISRYALGLTVVFFCCHKLVPEGWNSLVNGLFALGTSAFIAFCELRPWLVRLAEVGEST
jgi:O-antigen/teichoic acid export membrane protein